MKNRVWPILLASGIGLTLLLTLGAWQVKRLQWKQNLIAAYDAAIKAEPIAFDDALSQFIAGKSIDGMKVKLTGRYAPKAALRFLTSVNGGPGWSLVQGFEKNEGAPVLVNRGKLADGKATPDAPQGSVTIIGHIVWHDQGQGLFDGNNDVAGNRWYWWDLPEMANQFSTTHADPIDVVLDLVEGQPGTEGLVVEPPKANLRNNHLGYAITWFGLAAVLAVMTVIFLRSRSTEI